MYLAASGDKCRIHHKAALQHLSLQGCLFSLQQNVCENGRQLPNNSTVYGYRLYLFTSMYAYVHKTIPFLCQTVCHQDEKQELKSNAVLGENNMHLSCLTATVQKKKWPISGDRYLLIKAKVSYTTDASQIQSFAILAILLLCHLLGGSCVFWNKTNSIC